MKMTKVLLLLLGLITIVSCTNIQDSTALPKVTIRGEAQGTTFTIVYFDSLQRDLSNNISKILKDFDRSLSLWDTASAISKINNTLEGTQVNDSLGYLNAVLSLSKEVHQKTNGLFDPTVYPLVKAYGFGANIDSTPVDLDTLISLVGFDQVKFENRGELILLSKGKGQQLDFNAIAQGYSADVLAKYLKQNGISQFMIEIGGEIVIGDAKPNGSLWNIAIDKPIENGQRTSIDTLSLQNVSLATSGNYRKFYVKDGKKFAHTIHPKTGKPVDHQLLSATVITPNITAGEADALATFFMVAGVKKSLEFLESHGDTYRVMLIYEESGEMKTYKHFIGDE